MVKIRNINSSEGGSEGGSDESSVSMWEYA